MGMIGILPTLGRFYWSMCIYIYMNKMPWSVWEVSMLQHCQAISLTHLRSFARRTSGHPENVKIRLNLPAKLPTVVSFPHSEVFDRVSGFARACGAAHTVDIPGRRIGRRMNVACAKGWPVQLVFILFFFSQNECPTWQQVSRPATLVLVRTPCMYRECR